MRQKYETDLTDEQWDVIAPLFSHMRNCKWDKRELTNAVLYLVKTGVAKGLTQCEAISDAVKFCISNEIMKGYLEYHSEEVFNMLALQWDKASFDDEFDDGFASGLLAGKNNDIEAVAINIIRRSDKD